MARSRPGIEHLLRRAGFGASPEDLASFEDMSTFQLLDYLIDYEEQPDDVDSKIGNSAYIGVVARLGGFAPNTNIEDARQRWLFRMVHSQRPLQEKMALFWHNHFATAYSKIAGAVGQERATRMFDNDPASLAGTERGMIQKMRELGTGSFATLLWEIAGE